MEKQTKNRPFFACAAASLTILFGMSAFLSSFCVGRAMADTTSGDEAFLIVQDLDGKLWTELKELNVFANAKFDGKSIIAPGSKGSYTFTVQNISDFPMEYEIGFDEENLNGVPLEFRLKDGDGYLNENWTPATELADIREELANNSKTGYTLEWQWNYDGDDELDTAIGNNSAEIPYILKMSYTAEQSDRAVSPHGENKNAPQKDSSSQSDDRSKQTDDDFVQVDDSSLQSGDNSTQTGNSSSQSNDSSSQTGDSLSQAGSSLQQTGDSSTQSNDNFSQSGDSSLQTNEQSPKTGDNSNIPFLIALLICSCLTMFLTLLLWRRTDDYEDEEA